MPTLTEKPPTEKNPIEEVQPDVETQHDNVNLPRHRWKILIFVSLLLGSVLIIVAALQNSDKSDEEHLEVLQSKMEKLEELSIQKKSVL